MKKILLALALGSIPFLPLPVLAVGVSPGKVILGYVNTRTTTTLSFILSRGQTLGFHGFSLRTEGEGSTALRIPTSSIIFNPEDDRRSLGVSFAPGVLPAGYYEPLLVITPYVDLPNNERSQTLVPSLQATISFEVTTSPYLSISAYSATLRPGTLANEWRAETRLTNTGTEALELTGFSLVFSVNQTTKTSTFFFKKPLKIFSKEVRYIDETITTNDEVHPTPSQHIYWISSSSLPLHQTGTSVDFNVSNQSLLTSRHSNQKNFFWPMRAAVFLLIISGSGILYLKLRK